MTTWSCLRIPFFSHTRDVMPTKPARQTSSTTPFAGLRALIRHDAELHPDVLADELRRLGFVVRSGAFGAEPDSTSDEVDILFVIATSAVAGQARCEIAATTCPVIAVLGERSPEDGAILAAGAHGLLTLPLRPLDLVRQIELAIVQHGFAEKLTAKIAHLEDNLRKRRLIERVVNALAARGLSSSEAYGRLRRKAMSSRSTVADIAADMMAAINDPDPAVRDAVVAALDR
jgi:two-component system, response regulator PdtaR